MKDFYIIYNSDKYFKFRYINKNINKFQSILNSRI